MKTRLREARVGQLERELTELAKRRPSCNQLLTVPGIGLLTATTMIAATSGEVSHFRNTRHFAAWFYLSVCAETDCPSWLRGLRHHGLTPVTLLAPKRPLVAIGTP